VRAARSRLLGPLAATLVATLVAACVAACGSPQSPPAPRLGAPPAETSASGGQADAPLAWCPPIVDVADLLRRHARAFGDPAGVAADLPLTITGQLAQGAAKGAYEAFADDHRFASAAELGPLHVAEGTEGDGTWETDGLGSLVHHPAGESNDLAFETWLFRRAYVAAPKVEASCEGDAARGGAPVVHARLAAPALGDPELTFDLGTAALLSASYAQVDGSRSTRTFESWAPPDARGVRWPAAFTDRGEVGEAVRFTLAAATAGVRCRAGEGDACFAPRAAGMVVGWPASGRVRVPMDFALGELALRARIGDRDVWALLDSGAGITTLEAGSAAAVGFVSSLEDEGMGATQKVKLGLGELPAVAVGELTLAHVPVASVPIPALKDFGDASPSVILGWPLFEQMAVRIDYVRGELTFARDAGGLAAAGSTAVPFRSLGGKPIADAQVDGDTAPFELDTGNSGAFDVDKWWADAHRLPGTRPAIQVRGRFGAGEGETESTFVRVGEARLGAIVSKAPLVQIVDPGEHSIVAGLVGERAFARCAAVVFDFAKRTLWLEPPCDRPPLEDRGGWRLSRRESPDAADTPWVVGAVTPGGAAAAAGVQEGDRLVEVAGKRATSDVRRIVVACRQPAGSRVPVTVMRDGKVLHLVLVLADLLSGAPRPGR
jgi:hypothetical protein